MLTNEKWGKTKTHGRFVSNILDHNRNKQYLFGEKAHRFLLNTNIKQKDLIKHKNEIEPWWLLMYQI